MVAARHWYLSAMGKWQSGIWAGEIATIGIRGVLSDFGGGNFEGVNVSLPTFDVSATGTFDDTTEWSASYGFLGSGLDKTAQDDMAHAMKTFLATSSGICSSSFAWEEIRLAAIQQNGDYVNGATVWTLKSKIAGAVAGAPTGPTTCLVASLRTAGRGPRNRGRMYFPHHKAPQTGNGLAASADQSGLANRVDTLVAALDQRPLFRAAVVSQKWQTYSEINRIMVGDQIDQQQRRRRKLKENYYVV